MKELLNFTTGRLFPLQFIFIGIVLIPSGVVLLSSNLMLGVSFMLFGTLTLTSFQGVEIDTAAKRYREYNSYYFIKTGSWKAYQQAEKLYINPVKTSQQLSSQASTSSFKGRAFNAYIKFDNDEKFLLASDKAYEKVEAKVTELARFTSLPIIDNRKVLGY